jgi:bifunctional DNA-binding transcriptional regulator/antitoxin component of YhaV-PrlF toxin-antitoxin module
VTTQRFEAEIGSDDQGAVFVVVPDEVVQALGAGKRPPVLMHVHGETDRNRIAVYGGVSYLMFRKSLREKTGLKPGDRVEVTVELEEAPRTIEVPPDLASALEQAGVRATFDAMSFTHRKEWVRSVEEAKKPETRARRVAGAVEAMRDRAG